MEQPQWQKQDQYNKNKRSNSKACDTELSEYREKQDQLYIKNEKNIGN
jgi:hypothetical protein